MSALRGIFGYLLTAKRLDANDIGEMLRKWAFPGDGYGCYSTFDVRPECEEVKATKREFEFLWGRPFNDEQVADSTGWLSIDAEEIDRIVWYRHPSGIEFGWHWDGDGCLAFHVPELGSHALLRNSDCKKDYEWEFDPPRTGSEDHQS
jgi:hypothetical protein